MVTCYIEKIPKSCRHERPILPWLFQEVHRPQRPGPDGRRRDGGNGRRGGRRRPRQILPRSGEREGGRRGSGAAAPEAAGGERGEQDGAQRPDGVALRSRMDADVEQVLRLSKLIKMKLQALDQSNASHRKLPVCGPGSSADRTRTSVVVGLGRKLKDITDEFQALWGKMSAEYKETVERRYFTITGKRADEQTIEQLISSGDSETFVQKAISEQGRGQVLDTISEIQERHDAVKEMEKNLLDLHQVFLDMAALVEAQGQQLNDIESNVAHANSFVRRGSDQLQTAREYQKSSRKWTCIAIGIGLVVVCLILVPITPSLLKNTLS